MLKQSNRFVLLAEDNADDALLMQRACARAGVPNLYRVENGEEAIGCLQDAIEQGNSPQLPALILLDVKMPRRDGFEVLQWIKNQPQFVWVPVLMLTASSLDADLNRAKLLGADGFHVKPRTFEELVILMKEIRQRWLV